MVVSPTSVINGIWQGDLIVQSAIVEALKRMRDCPTEIDYVFHSLINDQLTSDEYGQAQIDSFKEWFLNSDIPVSPSWRVDQTVFPIITFSMQSSDEISQTLGDINYQTSEDTGADWPPSAGPFDPVSYSPSSGIMQLPDFVDEVVVVPGMYVSDRNSRQHTIIDTLDDDIISLTPGTFADFHGALLGSFAPRLTTSIESTHNRDVFSVGLHVQGESFYLIALHSILLYALQKYKEELLEAREFECSVITNTEFRRNNEFGNELVFSRWLQVSGLTRHVWAKSVRPKIKSVNFQNLGGQDTGIIISPVGENDIKPPVDEQGKPAQPTDPYTVRPQ